MKIRLDEVQTFFPALPPDLLDELLRAFPMMHFEELFAEGFPFYRTTFWLPVDREPEHVFESLAVGLRGLAKPSDRVTGIEWWFSVLRTNATPQWLLRCHFDRNDLTERSFEKLRFPEKASVLFLNSVPYGELVITDQVLTAKGRRPRQPEDMRFILPEKNLYSVYPGHLHHGVIGRMWRPRKATRLRVAMAVNYWPEKPKAPYIRDSRECLTAFRLDDCGGAASGSAPG